MHLVSSVPNSPPTPQLIILNFMIIRIFGTVQKMTNKTINNVVTYWTVLKTSLFVSVLQHTQDEVNWNYGTSPQSLLVQVFGRKKRTKFRGITDRSNSYLHGFRIRRRNFSASSDYGTLHIQSFSQAVKADSTCKCGKVLSCQDLMFVTVRAKYFLLWNITYHHWRVLRMLMMSVKYLWPRVLCIEFLWDYK